MPALKPPPRVSSPHTSLPPPSASFRTLCLKRAFSIQRSAFSIRYSAFPNPHSAILAPPSHFRLPPLRSSCAKSMYKRLVLQHQRTLFEHEPGPPYKARSKNEFFDPLARNSPAESGDSSRHTLPAARSPKRSVRLEKWAGARGSRQLVGQVVKHYNQKTIRRDAPRNSTGQRAVRSYRSYRGRRWLDWPVTSREGPTP